MFAGLELKSVFFLTLPLATFTVQWWVTIIFGYKIIKLGTNYWNQNYFAMQLNWLQKQPPCSMKKVFLKISQSLQEIPVAEPEAFNFI